MLFFKMGEASIKIPSPVSEERFTLDRKRKKHEGSFWNSSGDGMKNLIKELKSIESDLHRKWNAIKPARYK